jgi:peroxiredoxin Q/BCP
MTVEVSLQVGDAAPGIDAPTADAGRFRLADQRGRWVVVYFYPRASTPGCTAESIDFQDHKAELEGLDAVIVGVSADKAPDQLRFIHEHGFTFPMLPDPDHAIIGAYGVLKDTGTSARRVTFLVGPDGRVAKVWGAVKVAGHVSDVVDSIQRLIEST